MGGSLDLTTLPSCPKTCLEMWCSVTDLACICKPGVLDALDSCVNSNCTYPEAFYTCKNAHLACNIPARDHGVKLTVLALALGLSTGCTIISRILFKLFLTSRKRLDNDDWTIMTAIPTGSVLIGIVVLGINQHGLGTDIWGVSDEDIQIFGNYFFAVELLYMVLMTQIKLSLCFFYLNIFPGVGIRRCLWMTVVFHILTTVAFGLAIIFGCSPLEYSWTRYDVINKPFASGSCGIFNAGGWVYTGLSVASDLWLITIPLTQVSRLNLHIKKKIGIILMFLTGAFVTVVSILRLNTMKAYNNSSNPTWDQWSLVWWSCLEICTGFICTALPTMRLILIRIAPRVFGTDRIISQDLTLRRRVVNKQLCSVTLPTISDFKDPIQTTIERSSIHSQTEWCGGTELAVKSTTESTAESTTESTAESTTESTAESTTESTAESSTESTAESSTESKRRESATSPV
ncbi:hypothetical protein E4U42_007451 [Claviceps africana]|uniref:Rhodopsin domain-containing protein n=1 Tax=Claviceps africana TaxID=83212 RepID=A0A8K0J1C6_9HYPO|nr:hypothetical protein E4U42_007451 [Claviceps africana]